MEGKEVEHRERQHPGLSIGTSADCGSCWRCATPVAALVPVAPVDTLVPVCQAPPSPAKLSVNQEPEFRSSCHLGSDEQEHKGARLGRPSGHSSRRFGVGIAQITEFRGYAMPSPRATAAPTAEPLPRYHRSGPAS